jgi:hypothetical protein
MTLHHSRSAPRAPRAAGRIRLLIVAVVAAAAAACATAQTGGNPFEGGGGGGGGGAGGGEIRVYVQNLGFSSVRVHALTPRGDRSLGTVPSSRTESFVLAWSQTGTLSFRLDFQTAAPQTTPTVNVSSGNQVEIDIPATGGSATIRIR